MDESGYELKDYKIFCFNGEPKAMFIATDRGTDTKFDFFDTEFHHLPFTNGHPNADKEIRKPANFDEMRGLLTLTPINLKTANAFVQQYHRHHKPTRGHKFSIGVSDNGALVGVAICGRPVARRLDDGYTLEVNRLCTDGTPNACSILYAAAYRAARAMGYNKVITYILDTENGTSLKAAGYTCEGRAGGLEWNGAKAPKQADQYPRQMKTRWVKKKEGLYGS